MTTLLDARAWNTSIITLVFVGLIVSGLFGVGDQLVQQWQRGRRKRREAKRDTPPTRPGS